MLFQACLPRQGGAGLLYLAFVHVRVSAQDPKGSLGGWEKVLPQSA